MLADDCSVGLDVSKGARRTAHTRATNVECARGRARLVHAGKWQRDCPDLFFQVTFNVKHDSIDGC